MEFINRDTAIHPHTNATFVPTVSSRSSAVVYDCDMYTVLRGVVGGGTEDL